LGGILAALEGRGHNALDRVPALDGVRGVAILLVLVAHFRLVSMSTAADHLYNTTALAGYSGVDLFFVLSGFLITGILLDAKQGTAAGYFRNFYARRALRILPLYYGIVAALTLVWPHVHPRTQVMAAMQHDQLWYWLHATNILAAISHGAPLPYATGHFWSLAVEEQFYLVWPFVVWFSDDRRLLRICVACVVLAFALRLALVSRVDVWAIYGLPVTRMDTLTIGAALAVLARAPDGLTRYRGLAVRLGIPAAVVWATLYVVSSSWQAADPAFRTVGYTAAAVMYGCVIIAVLTMPAIGVAIGHPMLRFFGKYSYGMYVFHMPLMLFIGPIYAAAWAVPPLLGSRLPSQLVFLVLGVAATSLVAMVSWYGYEQHFLALKRFFPQAHPRTVAGPSERRHTSSGGALDPTSANY
jgi:peptidoglycan/LPS O-acetylase OafA/YrhL